jgi:hypothetical protein
MTRFGTLSPIDPSVANEFNPEDAASRGDRIPIAVEDVLAYFQLASEQAGDDAALAEDAFRKLAESVHPLALGNVKRNIEQIWQLAKKLIQLHTPDRDDEELTALVRRLTTELYSHSHMLGRTEAAQLGLPVDVPSPRLEERLLAYYEQLKADLRLLEKFDPRAADDEQLILERAYGETPTTSDAFVTRGVVSQPDTFDVESERWERIA